MNVREYFESKFPGHVYEQDRDAADLESMPLDSNCGDDCKKAIDAAFSFAECSRMAHGDDESFNLNLGNSVVSIVGVYICG